MIYTFKIINGLEKRMFFANNKEDAFLELRARLGTKSEQYSLISFVKAEDFNLTIY